MSSPLTPPILDNTQYNSAIDDIEKILYKEVGAAAVKITQPGGIELLTVLQSILVKVNNLKKS